MYNLDDQTDESRDQSEEKGNNPESEEMGDDSEGNDERADNHSLSNKLPTNVEFAWTKVCLEEQNYQNIPDLRKQNKPESPLALFGLLFDEELVYQIVEFTNFYGKRKKTDNKFEILNEKFRLFLAILLLSGIISSLNNRCIGKQCLIHLCKLFLTQCRRTISKGFYDISPPLYQGKD